MSFFGFRQDNEDAQSKMYPLRSIEQWTSVLEESDKNTLLIFKHSTRCPISSMVLRRFEKEWFSRSESNDYPCYYLDLIAHRAVSNAISEDSRTIHQSPQLLAIYKKHTFYHASHDSINASTVAEKIKDHLEK